MFQGLTHLSEILHENNMHVHLLTDLKVTIGAGMWWDHFSIGQLGGSKLLPLFTMALPNVYMKNLKKRHRRYDSANMMYAQSSGVPIN